MLKLLAGLVYGGLMTSTGLRRETSWLRVLFGLDDWPPGWGFYLIVPDGQIHASDGLEIETRVVGDELWAAEIGVAGFALYLALGTPEGQPSLRHRPSEIIMRRTDQGAVKRLVLEWPTGPATGTVEFSRVGQYGGPRPHDRGYEKG